MKKKVLRSILAAIAATSLALGFLPGNLAVNLGIVTESEAAGGYQIVNIAAETDVRSVAQMLPSGVSFEDVKTYANQALAKGEIKRSDPGVEEHIYMYAKRGEIFDQDPNDLKRGAVPCHAFQVWGTDGEVNYTQIDSNGEWPSYSSYPMDPNNPDPTKLVFHVFLLSASSNTGSNVSGVPEGVEEIVEAEEQQPPHIHDYHWEAVTDPTIDRDGEMQYRCSCGDVKEKQPIPAAQIYVKGLYGAVKEAAPNGTVEYDAGKLNTISDYILNKMSERSDVTVNVKFEYKGMKYQITFPAGTDYTKVLTDEPTMYGYFGVAAELGLTVTEL